MKNIAFVCRHLATGGMPRFVLNSIKSLDTSLYRPFIFEKRHAHIDEIRNEILSLPNVIHSQCQPQNLAALCQQNKIDLIHYHDWDENNRPLNIPSIETVHTPFLNVKIGHADLYLLISDHQIPFFSGKNYRRIDTFIDNNEFDPTLFNREEIRNELGWDTPIVVCIGIVAPYKNQSELLKVWDTDIATLIFVGPLAENFKPYYQPLVDKYQSKNIHFLGARNDIPRLLSACDIAINCSRFEGCCLSNLEAASMQKPLVVSDIPQNTQVFTNNQTALIEPVNYRFVKAISRLIDDKTLAKKISENAHKMVLSKFSIKKFGNKMNDIYHEMIPQKKEVISERQTPKAKILYSTPGYDISIPPTGWGAVEKVIGELQKKFRAKGYIFDAKNIQTMTKDEIEDYDYIHCHFYYNAEYLANLGIDFYLTIHDPYVFLNDVLFTRYEYMIETSQKTILSSSMMCEQFQHLSKKTVKISTGVDTKTFYPSADGCGDYALCVGKGDKRKQFNLAVSACMDLNIPIKIVGPIGDDKKLYELIEEYPQAEYLGEISLQELQEVYRQANFLIHPSQSETGPSLVVLEAMASGLPVIASAVCCSDFTHEGVFACDPTIESIKEKISIILANRNAYGKNNRTIVEKQYDWGIIADKYIDILYSNNNSNDLAMPIKSTKHTISYPDGGGVKIEIPSTTHPEQYHFKVFCDNELTYETQLLTQTNTDIWAKGNGHLWFTLYRYELWQDNELVDSQSFNLQNNDVFISLPNTLGDTLAWMPFIDEFHKKHNCNLTIKTQFPDFYRKALPNIRFTKTAIQKYFYKYQIGIYSQPHEHKIPWQMIPLQKIASDMLGLNYVEKIIDLTPLADERQFRSKYVCIAPRSTMKAKEWNWNVDQGKIAWKKVVNWLINEGYEVVWISKEDCYLENVIDKSGDLSLIDRVTDLTHADFFIGLPAGLSWLAHYCRTYVFMITGFSSNWCEFQKNVTRIFKQDVCRGCFNDSQHDFTREWDWCPNGRHFQCTSMITPQMVIEEIKRWINEQ